MLRHVMSYDVIWYIYDIIWYDMIYMISYDIHDIIWYHIYDIIWYHMTCYHMISCHIISRHVTSYHIIPYHIMSYYIYYIILISCVNCSDHYYIQVAWRNAETVMITWANRVQNESISVIYKVTEATPTYNEVNYASVNFIFVNHGATWRIRTIQKYHRLKISKNCSNKLTSHWRH